MKTKEFEVFGKLSTLDMLKLLDRFDDLNTLEEMIKVIVNYKG